VFVEDPDFTKQNDCNSAASPLTSLPAKLMKQGFDVPSQHAAAYRSEENQLKGALMLRLHPKMELLHGTGGNFL
jgi:hypothetical protein